MAEFKPINTQEEFDTAISARLERERSKYADYEDLKQQVTTLTTERDTANYLSPEEAAKKDAKIKGYETDSVKTRIAREKGIPAEMASRPTGETEEEIMQDADTLAQIFKASKGTAPLFDNSQPVGDDKDAALKELLQNLNN